MAHSYYYSQWRWRCESVRRQILPAIGCARMSKHAEDFYRLKNGRIGP
jgi:hypothetical protein